jgi:hypothetical protein
VNQRKTPSIDGLFVPLGTHDVQQGDKVVVSVSNKATDGYVVVDGLQLLPSK